MTPPPDPATRPPLPVRDTGAVPVLVPHLLGFVPDRSLVILGLGSRREVALTLRWDIPADDAFTDDALECYVGSLPALARGGVETAVLVLYPGTPGCAWDDHVPLGDLPLRRLVLGLREALDNRGVHVQDALCVVGDRYASYLCEDLGCCPPEGRPVDETAALDVVAELVASGSAPLRSREALVEALSPRDRDDTLVRDSRRVLGAALLRLPTDPMARVEAFLEDVVRWGQRPGAMTVPSRYVALAGHLVESVTTRDLLLRELAVELSRPQLHAVRLVLTEAVRCSRADKVAAPASVLSVAAYLCGDGAAARVALERALEADKTYSLAGVVSDMLDEGIPPGEWRMVLAGLSVQEILDAGRPGRRSEPA